MNKIINIIIDIKNLHVPIRDFQHSVDDFQFWTVCNFFKFFDRVRKKT